ncbi:MAG: substrate-binding domain-containing protein, partial [Flavisolibacter sp.]
MYRTIVGGFIFSALIFFTSCGNNDGGNIVITTYDSGTIYISVDESFKPVIDEEIKVYEAWRPKTKLIVHYKSEAECLKDFATDSITMIISTLGFTESQRMFMIDSMRVSPFMRVTAYDAIAVIVNPYAPDSLFTMEEIRNMITGTDKRYIPVFDGLSATSTVRYMLDSVVKMDSLGSHVKAADNSIGVID